MVTKLHIDFNKPLKQKDRLLSLLTSRKTLAGLILILIIIWMAPGFFGGNKEEKATNKRNDTQKILTGDFNSPKLELSDGKVITWGQKISSSGKPIISINGCNREK